MCHYYVSLPTLDMLHSKYNFICDCSIRVYLSIVCTAVKYQALENTMDDVTENNDKASAGLPSRPQSDHLFNTQQLNIGKFPCSCTHMR